MSGAGATSFPIIRAAQITRVDHVKRTCSIEYLDSNAYSKEDVSLTQPYAGRGWGVQVGVEPGTLVLVGHGYHEIPEIIAYIPNQHFTDPLVYGRLDVNFNEGPYRTIHEGEIVLQSKKDAAITMDDQGGISLETPLRHNLGIDNTTGALFSSSWQSYINNESIHIRSGRIKRDLRSVPNFETEQEVHGLSEKGEELFINKEFGPDFDVVLDEIGKNPFHPTLHMDIGSLGEVASHLDNKLSTKYSENEALSEIRFTFREFADSYIYREDRRSGEGFVRKSDKQNKKFLRQNVVELADSDLGEIVLGPLVDINGLPLDINRGRILIQRDADKAPISSDNVMIDGHALYPNWQSPENKFRYPTHLNHVSIVSIELNTLGGDYKRMMHHDETGKFRGEQPGEVSLEYITDPVWDSTQWDNIVGEDVKDATKVSGPHMLPKWQLSIDHEGVTKLHIPSSSVEHPVAEWTKWDLTEANETDRTKPREKKKNKALFDRVSSYGGELFHPMHRVAAIVMDDRHVLDKRPFESVGRKDYHLSMLSPIGVEVEDELVSTIGKTNWQDNKSGKAHPWPDGPYCPIGQSVKFATDGRIDMSIGRDHADWKSLVADFRGGIVAHVGRMLDAEGCDCTGKVERFGLHEHDHRSGEAAQNLSWDDRRSFTVEADGSVAAVIGRSVYHERSIDANMKAGVKLHLGKPNYGIPTERNKHQYFRSYDPTHKFEDTSGYEKNESGASSEAWDEFSEIRHDRIKYNPRIIDGTFTGSGVEDFIGLGLIDPSNTAGGKTPPPTHVSTIDFVVNDRAYYGITGSPIPENRTRHFEMEKVAYEVAIDASPLPLDNMLPMSISQRETEAGSLNLNLESDAWITIRDNENYTFGNGGGSRTSLVLDTSGSIVAFIGADNRDYRSLSMEMDGGIQATIGKTATMEKSINALLKGGLKLVIGQDADVEHVQTTSPARIIGYKALGFHKSINKASLSPGGGFGFTIPGANIMSGLKAKMASLSGALNLNNLTASVTGGLGGLGDVGSLLDQGMSALPLGPENIPSIGDLATVTKDALTESFATLPDISQEFNEIVIDRIRSEVPLDTSGIPLSSAAVNLIVQEEISGFKNLLPTHVAGISLDLSLSKFIGPEAITAIDVDDIINLQISPLTNIPGEFISALSSAADFQAGVSNFIASGSNIIKNIDREGRSINIKATNSSWLMLGHNEALESLVLDAEGKIVAQVGADVESRSIALETDGSINAAVGPGPLGRSIWIKTATGVLLEIALPDIKGDAVHVHAFTGNARLTVDAGSAYVKASLNIEADAGVDIKAHANRNIQFDAGANVDGDAGGIMTYRAPLIRLNP